MANTLLSSFYYHHRLFITIILLSSILFISKTESVTSLCTNIKSCNDCLSLKGIGCRWIQAWSNYNGTTLSPINEKCDFLSAFGPLDTDPTKVYKVYENACPCQLYQYGFETDPMLTPEYNFTENGAPLSGFSAYAYEGDRSFLLSDPNYISDTKLTLTVFLDPIVIGSTSIQLNFQSLLYMEYGNSIICFDGAFIMIEEDTYSNDTFYEIDYTEYVVSIPYTQTISENFFNPYAGHVAWCRSSSTTIFDKVFIDLTQFAGKTIKISWVTGSDNGFSSVGWYIDDIHIVYDCVIKNSCSFYNNDCETCLSTTADDISCVWYKSWNVKSPITESCVSSVSAVQPTNMTAPVVLYKTNTTYPELSCPCVTFSETFENGINTTYSILQISEPFSGISSGYASETNSLHLGEVPYPSAENFTLLNLEISGPSSSSVIELCFDSIMRLEQSSNGCFDAAFITIQYNETSYYEDVESLLSKPYLGPISMLYDNPYAGKRGWCDEELTLFKTPLERICIDLSMFNGHQLNITWTTASDSSVSRDGWYIDNIELNNNCKRSNTDNKKKHHKKKHHDDDDDDGTGLIIGLIIGGIVLIGIIVFIIYMTNRRSNRIHRQQRTRYQYQQYNY